MLSVFWETCVHGELSVRQERVGIGSNLTDHTRIPAGRNVTVPSPTSSNSGGKRDTISQLPCFEVSWAMQVSWGLLGPSG